MFNIEKKYTDNKVDNTTFKRTYNCLLVKSKTVFQGGKTAFRRSENKNKNIISSFVNP